MSAGLSSVEAIAALITPPGRGAVATIALHGDAGLLDGPPPMFAAANGRATALQPLNRVCFGRWGIDPAEEVVVCRTGASTCEIHCHGGAAAVQRILTDLSDRGCRIVNWPDLLAATSGLLESECMAALTQATTLRTARILLEQQSGLLRAAIDELCELPLDEVVTRTSELLSWSDFGLHLTQPWKVVLCGPPNVGKSSLINALLGYSRSIVYDQPGTTRDVVTGQTALEGWPVELSDTAGLRGMADELEAAGIERARQRVLQADCVVLVLDRSRPLDDEELELIRELPQAVCVANKIDLANAWSAAAHANVIPVSAVTHTGLEELSAAIVQKLVPRVPAAGTAIPVTARQIALLQSVHNAAVAGDQYGVQAAIRSS